MAKAVRAAEMTLAVIRRIPEAGPPPSAPVVHPTSAPVIPEGSPSVPDGAPMRVLSKVVPYDTAKPEGRRETVYFFLSTVDPATAKDMTEVVVQRVQGVFVPVD